MAKVDLDIDANIADALKSIKTLEKQFSKTDFDASIDLDLGSVKKKLSTFRSNVGSTLEGVSKSFFNLKTLAGTALAGFSVGKFVQAASVQEKAVKSLNTALALSGELTDETSADIQRFASALQATSTVGDEASLQMFALAKSFGASNDQAKLILRTAVDLSAQTGQTLESSVRNLSKTLGGFKGELGEAHSELAVLTKEQLQAGAALTILGEKFDGAAFALTKTFGGALEQTQGALGDLFEVLGNAIVKNDDVIAAFNLTTEIFVDLSKALGGIRKVAATFVSKVIKVIVRSLPFAIKVVEVMHQGINALVLAFDALKLAVNRAVDLIIIGLDFLLLAIGEVISRGLNPFFDGLETIVSGLESAGLVSRGTAASFRSSFDDITAAVEAGSSSLSGLADAAIASSDKAEAAFDDQIQSIKDTSASYDIASLKAEGYATRLDVLAAEASNADDNLKALSNKNINVNVRQNFSVGEVPSPQIIEETLTPRETIQVPYSPVLMPDEEFITDFGDLIPDLAGFGDVVEVPLKPKFVAPPQKSIEGGEFEVNVTPKVDDRGLTEVQQKLEKLFNDNSFFGEFKKAGIAFGAVISDAFDFISNGLSSMQGIGSIATGVLQGEEGARSLISSGAGAIANYYLPGSGPIVSSIVTELSKGPEHAREMVQEFARALPILLENISEAIPVVLETLFAKAPEIIVAIVKNSAKIVVPLTKALVKIGPILAQAILEELAAGIDFYFGTDFGPKFDAATEKWRGITEDLQDSFADKIAAGVERIKGSLGDTGESFARVGKDLGKNFSEGAKDFGDAISQAFQAFLKPLKSAGSIFSVAGKGFTVFSDDLNLTTRNLGRAIESLFKFKFPDLPDLPKITLPEFPELKLPPIGPLLAAPFNAIIRLLNSLKIPKVDVGFRALGRNVNFTLIPDIDLIPGDIPLLKLQRGGEIPEGFPNDSFPARLTSGENVIDRGLSQDLKSFLSGKESGGDMTIILQVGEEQLANVLVNLNSQGFRTA